MVRSSPTAMKASCNASRQCAIVGRPARSHFSCDKTLYAGLGAGRGNASDVVGSTRAGSSPISAKIARVKTNHDASPALVQW